MIYSGGVGNPSSSFLPLAGGTLSGDLQLGPTNLIKWGTTSSFPALKRSTTALHVRLADDSGYGYANARQFVATGSADSGCFAQNASSQTLSYIDVTGVSVAANLQVLFSNSTTNAAATKDVGIVRNGVNKLNVTNGGSGNGDLSLEIGRTTAGQTMTENNRSIVRRTLQQFSWTNAMVTALGAVTAGDISVAVLPAKMCVLNAYLVITGAAAGPATVTVAVGRTGATYIDYLTAQDAKAAANTVYGDAAAERGTNLTGYDLPSYTGATTIYAHFISTGANLDTVTGSTGTIYLETMLLP